MKLEVVSLGESAPGWVFSLRESAPGTVFSLGESPPGAARQRVTFLAGTRKVTKRSALKANAHLTERVNRWPQPHRWSSGLRCGQCALCLTYHRSSEVRERQPYRPTV